MPFCIYCGTRASSWDRYCHVCGKSIHARPSFNRLLDTYYYGLKGRTYSRHRLLRYSLLLCALVLVALAAFLVPFNVRSMPTHSQNLPVTYLVGLAVTIILTVFALVRTKGVGAKDVDIPRNNIPAPINSASNTFPEGLLSRPEPVVSNLPTHSTSSPSKMSQKPISAPGDKEFKSSMGKLLTLKYHPADKMKRTHRRRLILLSSVSLLIMGAVSLLEAAVYSSTVLTFIGLGLTFWGMLFIFVQSVSYVRSELVDYTALSSIQTIDRIIYDLGFLGKGIYFPVKGEDPIRVFVPAGQGTALPSEEAIGDTVMCSDPKGLIILPPGLELAKFFHERLAEPDQTLAIGTLKEELPKLFTKDLELMKDFRITVDGDLVRTKSTGSIYSDFCSEIKLKTRVCVSFGCPMCSAIACLIVEASGNPVRIETDETSNDGYVIETTYRILHAAPSIRIAKSRAN